MKKLYEKSEIWFAVAWIIAYCFFLSLGDNISASLGVINVVTFPSALLLSVVLFLFLKRNGLMESYGLCKSKVSAREMVFYIPVLLMLTANLWYGVGIYVSPLEAICYASTMLCVGFLEEVIFRGLLFNALSVFVNEEAMTDVMRILSCVFLIVVCGGYGAYIEKMEIGKK